MARPHPNPPDCGHQVVLAQVPESREPLVRAYDSYTHRVSLPEPIRSPRGLDEVIEALPDRLSLTEKVNVLNAPVVGLHGLTPLEWLRDEGSGVLVTFELLTPAELVEMSLRELGTVLVESIVPTAARAELLGKAVRAMPGADELAQPHGLSEKDRLRLVIALHAALVLKRSIPDRGVRDWFEAPNRKLDGMTPALVLRTWRTETAHGFGVVVAARMRAGLPL